MRKLILLASLLLVACGSKVSVPEAPVMKYTPPENDPISVYVPHFYVITEANALQLLATKKVLIAVDYNDSIELRKSLEDVNAFILKEKQNQRTLSE
ncbi:MAG: hypothetical protein [Caudoviricetes sp.]|nr:MAG: hypothetical protein [Caudoviricetes sp.]